MLTDVCMLILMPMLMLYSLIGEALHEWLGVAMLLLFLMHHLLNWRWHKNMFKGKYNLQRSAGTVIDILIAICMILTGISGMTMSNHVFQLDVLSIGISLSRKLHLICSHWLFVLICIHVGMHLNVMKGYFGRGTSNNQNKAMSRTGLIIKVFFVILGIYCFVVTNTWNYMTYQMPFMYFDFSKPVYMTYAKYLSVLILFIILGDGLSNAMKYITVGKQKVSRDENR